MLLCAIVALLQPPSLRAQFSYLNTDTIYGSVLLGFHGFERSFAEVGVARLYYDPGNDAGPVLMAHGASVMVSPGDTMLLAAGVSGWYHAFIFGVGWSVTYYTDLHGGTFRISPQFILGLDRINVSAAWIFPLTNPDFVGVPKGELVARWTLPVLKFPKRRR